MNNSTYTIVVAIAVAIVTSLLVGCGAKGPAPIDPKKTEWLDYSDTRIGFAIKYPATYNFEPKGGGEIWVIGPDKKLAYRVCYVTYEEAKKRGLWVQTEPVGNEYISNGRTSHKYVYKYGNAFTFSRTAAYVIEREGKMLALEIRLDRNNEAGTLDPGQEEVLRTFTIL